MSNFGLPCANGVKIDPNLLPTLKIYVVLDKRCFQIFLSDVIVTSRSMLPTRHSHGCHMSSWDQMNGKILYRLLE